VGHAHFDVAGPEIDHFAVQHAAAAAMQKTLNASDHKTLTTAERRAVRLALSLVLAGESEFTVSQLAAMRAALEKLA
jgi:uncharacterized protein YfiM (DUF2279 family)